MVKLDEGGSSGQAHLRVPPEAPPAKAGPVVGFRDVPLWWRFGGSVPSCYRRPLANADYPPVAPENVRPGVVMMYLRLDTKQDFLPFLAISGKIVSKDVGGAGAAFDKLDDDTKVKAWLLSYLLGVYRAWARYEVAYWAWADSVRSQDVVPPPGRIPNEATVAAIHVLEEQGFAVQFNWGVPPY